MIFTTFFSYSTNKTESSCANSRYSQCFNCFSYLVPAVLTSPAQVSTELEESNDSSTAGSNADDDYDTTVSPTRSPYPLGDDMPFIRPELTRRPSAPPDSITSHEDGRCRLFETPQTLRSESPITPQQQQHEVVTSHVPHGFFYEFVSLAIFVFHLYIVVNIVA